MLKIIISLIVTASISCQKHLDNNETEIGQNDIKDWKIHSELFQVDLEPKFNPTQTSIFSDEDIVKFVGENLFEQDTEKNGSNTSSKTTIKNVQNVSGTNKNKSKSVEQGKSTTIVRNQITVEEKTNRPLKIQKDPEILSKNDTDNTGSVRSDVQKQKVMKHFEQNLYVLALFAVIIVAIILLFGIYKLTSRLCKKKASQCHLQQTDFRSPYEESPQVSDESRGGQQIDTQSPPRSH